VTEYLKIMSLCETHVVGIVQHFTGPVAAAALANCLATFPGPVLFEYNYGDRPIDFLPSSSISEKGNYIRICAPA
jgi:galactonate dehydratase